MMARRSAADAAQTRQDLLAAAVNVFGDCGFAAARVEDIAAGAGVTRGAFYHHFRDKAEVYDALLREEAQRALDPVFAELGDGESSPLERLRRFLLGFARAIEQDARLRTILDLLLFGETGVPAGTKELTEQGFRAWADVFESLLREADARDELREGVAPEAAAAAMLTVAVGFTTTLLRAPTAYPASTSVEAVCDVLLDGITR